MKNIKPIKKYPNAEKYKSIIYKENRNKSGIYRWINLITGRSYIGSSINLGNRFKDYFSPYKLKKALKTSKSMIYSSFLKNGSLNYKLEILEYRTFPDNISEKEKRKILLEREQHYLDIFKPEYNILTKAGSRLGAKDLPETKELIKKSIGYETRKALSIGYRGRKMFKKVNTFRINKIIRAETRLKLSFNTHGISVEMDDFSNNFMNKFPSIKSAAKFINVAPSTLSKIYYTGVSYDEYTYKFIRKDLRVWVYNSDNKFIEILENGKKVCEKYNIPKSTLSYHIKFGKLYKNKLYFYNFGDHKTKTGQVKFT